jgi:hypothetical protein
MTTFFDRVLSGEELIQKLEDVHDDDTRESFQLFALKEDPTAKAQRKTADGEVASPHPKYVFEDVSDEVAYNAWLLLQ